MSSLISSGSPGLLIEKVWTVSPRARSCATSHRMNESLARAYALVRYPIVIVAKTSCRGVRPHALVTQGTRPRAPTRTSSPAPALRVTPTTQHRDARPLAAPPPPAPAALRTERAQAAGLRRSDQNLVEPSHARRPRTTDAVLHRPAAPRPSSPAPPRPRAERGTRSHRPRPAPARRRSGSRRRAPQRPSPP